MTTEDSYPLEAIQALLEKTHGSVFSEEMLRQQLMLHKTSSNNDKKMDENGSAKESASDGTRVVEKTKEHLRVTVDRGGRGGGPSRGKWNRGGRWNQRGGGQGNQSGREENQSGREGRTIQKRRGAGNTLQSALRGLSSAVSGNNVVIHNVNLNMNSSRFDNREQRNRFYSNKRVSKQKK